MNRSRRQFLRTAGVATTSFTGASHVNGQLPKTEASDDYTVNDDSPIKHLVIGHYHTAGNPGRGEIDNSQEISYPAIMREIVKTGYTSFVAHEFIPTWEDKIASPRHGVEMCDSAVSP